MSIWKKYRTQQRILSTSMRRELSMQLSKYSLSVKDVTEIEHIIKACRATWESVSIHSWQVNNFMCYTDHVMLFLTFHAIINISAYLEPVHITSYPGSDR